MLLQKCIPVVDFGPALKFVLDQMYETMEANHGLGLAANQVGFFSRMFVMRDANYMPIYFVNPEILSRSEASANLPEGCLSAPGEFLELDERSEWVQVKFLDENGQEHVRVFKGIYSVCVQHEIDHLDGKTHLQSPTLTKADRKKLAKKWGLK